MSKTITLSIRHELEVPDNWSVEDITDYYRKGVVGVNLWPIKGYIDRNKNEITVNHVRWIDSEIISCVTEFSTLRPEEC